MPIDMTEMMTAASRHTATIKMCKAFLCLMITSMICNIDRECNIRFMVTFAQKKRAHTLEKKSISTWNFVRDDIFRLIADTSERVQAKA